jgi:hypothetical protein
LYLFHWGPFFSNNYCMSLRYAPYILPLPQVGTHSGLK